MKKILSLLASFSLIATTAVTVVACTTNDSNNPNTSLNEVKAWFNNAQPDKNLQTEGQTMLIAIGGRYNSDTLSYLATLTQLINGNRTINPNNILEQDNIKDFEQTLGNYNLKDQADQSKANWQTPLRMMINAVSSAPDPGEDLNQSSIIAKKYFFYNSTTPIEQMSFHTILVDKVEEFWNTTLGKGIIEDILGQQLKDFLKFIVEDEDAPSSIDIDDLVNDQEKFDKFIKDKTKNLLSILQADNTKGPWFLVVRSGKIIGIKTGFRNYYEFNSEYRGAEDQRRNSLRGTNNLAAETWTQFSESIVKSLKNGIDWLSNNFLTTSKDVSSLDLIEQNTPNNTNNAWTSKISGTSNITDLDKPRGEEIDDNEEQQNTYRFPFLD